MSIFFPLKVGLFPYQHLARSREIACSQPIKIHATRHRFTHLVFAVPIRRTGAPLIDASSLLP